jgi:hypothetical protein
VVPNGIISIMAKTELDTLKDTILELEDIIAQRDLKIESMQKGIDRLSSDMRLNVSSSNGYTNWPPFIMTTAFSIITCCDSVYKSVKHADQTTRAFYGITWDEDTIYCSRVLDDEDGRSEHLISLGPDFKEIDVLPGIFSSAHQIHYHENSIAIASPGEETRGWLLDTTTHEAVIWGDNIDNAEHLNAVYRDDNSWWVNFNNHTLGGKSKIVNLSDDFSTIIETIDIGDQAHNIARVGDLLYICSSGEGKLLVYSLSTKNIVDEVEGLDWVRGLVITDDYILVGSAVKTTDQAQRLNSCTEVHLIDRTTLVVLDTLTFSECGPVYELRGIGPVDLAHNGIAFPGIV